MKTRFYSGTAASLLDEAPITGSRGGLINAYPAGEGSTSFPRIEAGKFKNIKKICGIFNLVSDRGDSFLIEVLPKSFEGTGSAGSVDVWLSFFDVLRADGLFTPPHGFVEKFMQSKGDTTSQRSAVILETFLLDTLGCLVVALRRGTPLTALREQVSSIAIRGRVDWSAQIRKHGELKHKHEVDSQTLSFDSRLYCFIRSAFEELVRRQKSILVSARARLIISQLRQAVEPFPRARALEDQRHMIQDFLRLTPPRFAHLKESIAALSKWIYGESTDVSRDVAFNLSGFSINLEKIFERWCRAELSRSLGEINSTLRIPSSEQSFYWGLHSSTESTAGSHGREIKPDILVYETNLENQIDVHVIADVKYKQFTSSLGNLVKNSEDQIDRYDLFQVLAYKNAFAENQFLTWIQNRDLRFCKNSQPKLIILVPTDVASISDGFYTVDRAQWTMKIVGMPFNAYLKGHECRSSVTRILRSLVDQDTPKERSVS